MAAPDDDLPYRVEVWDDKDSHIEEVIALTSDYATAKSAYEAAVKAGTVHHSSAKGENNSEHADELTIHA